jgi:hypothetical protein
VLSVTEHLEYQPHLADIPHPDRNRAFDETVQAAAESDLIVIRGSEITRDAPAGHINAIFLQDANDLLRVDAPDDPADVRAYYEAAGAWPAQQAVQAANDQGAFVFWNHPYWSSDFPNGIPVIPEFHIDNARDGLLHGVEIANGDSYSEETFQITLDHDLTLIGVSDVHDLIDWDYAPHAGGHRPVTLVGTIRNQSDAHFQLLNRSDLTFFEDGDLIDVPAHGTRTLQVKTPSRLSDVTLAFTVMNALTAPKENPSIRLHAPVDRE